MKKIILGLIIFLAIIGIVKVLEYKQIITWELKFPEVVQEQITPATNSTTTAQVYFLDIGQGDATLIVFPNKEEMLVDCAKDAVILSALSRVRRWNDRTIDYLVVSHPDADHYAGCIDVLERYEIKKIILTGYQKNSGQLWTTFMDTVKQAEARGTVVEYISAQTTLKFNGIAVNFLYPDHNVAEDPRVPQSSSIDSNDTSIVIKLSAGSNDILLTADAELPLETYLATKYAPVLEAELLKVGHHGSLTSSDEKFLQVVNPEYCIISSGAGNSYGHPVPRVLKRLERYKCQILRTDQAGDILFSLSAQGIVYEK